MAIALGYYTPACYQASYSEDSGARARASEDFDRAYREASFLSKAFMEYESTPDNRHIKFTRFVRPSLARSPMGSMGALLDEAMKKK